MKLAADQTLKSVNLINTTHIYEGVKQAMDELQIPVELRDTVLLKLSNALGAYAEVHIDEAKKWLLGIIHDLKTQQ